MNNGKYVFSQVVSFLNFNDFIKCIKCYDGNYKVLDFCGGIKPYLLVEMDNHMGTATRVEYGSSTQFFLEDEAAGQPWVTIQRSPQP